MSETILITGGAGFIGSALVRRLVGEAVWRVVNVDALTYAGNPDSIREVAESSAYTFHHLDIVDRSRLRQVVATHRPTAVVHLAAESHVDRSIDAPRRFVQANILGTLSLLEVCTEYWRNLAQGAKARFRLLHVSTDEVFGSLGGGREANETHPYAPNSPYAATKAAADHLVRAWYRTYGLPALTTTCGNNFGPFQFPEKLIPHVILRALHREPIPVYGDGRHTRDWIFVEDHVDALRTVLDRGRIGAVYNIGARCRLENLSVVRAVCDFLDELRPLTDGTSYAALIENVEDRPGHDRRYATDPSRIESELGWKPGKSFGTALRATVRWYLDNEWWWRRVLDGTYRLERLGLEA